MKFLFVAGLAFAIVLLSGCVGPDTVPVDTSISSGVEPTEITSFSNSNREICKQDGKPIIRQFSTTWCPHCIWVKSAYDSTVREYVEQGKIVAYHWELDTEDDTLTAAAEGGVPESELEVFRKFNPRESIPTFVFGCKYYRVGNGFENGDDITAEIGEFKAVIEELLKE